MSKVRDYYESNTWKFLLLGTQSGAIHRELWAPEVRSRRQAIDHVHELVLEQVRALRPDGRARVLDLGCGVGAASLFLGERMAAEIHGVTLSPKQAHLARRWARLRRRRLLGSCAFWAGDFCALAPEIVEQVGGSDLAFAIEAFVHAGSADAFFRQAAATLRPGGRLVLIDDFLVEGAADGARDTRLLEDVRAGWHIQALISDGEAVRLAGQHGFDRVAAIDLSRFQRIGRPRDRAIRALLPVLRRAARVSPWAQALVGGDALQECHRRGLLSYTLLVLARR